MSRTVAVLILLLLVALGCQEADEKGAREAIPPSTKHQGSSNGAEVEEARNTESPRIYPDDHQAVRLPANDVVRPRLVQEIHWVPGKQGSLQVEITATDDSGESRVLGYEALGDNNPVAEINYLDGDLNYHSLEHVELSDRPGEGVYSAEFDHPDGARGADVIVRMESERDDLDVEPLPIKGIPIEFDLMFGGSRSGD